MNVDIRDAGAMQAVQPSDVAAYLRANQWQLQQARLGTATQWLRMFKAEEYEALLPMDAGVSDYALRLGELLQVLSVAERRSQAQVYRDLVTASSDVVRIRIADPELNDGTMPIEENAQIAQKSRDLILAAACSATEFRAVWHNRKPEQAMEQVRKVRVGQTEQGSYVISVLSRIAPLLLPDGEPNTDGRLFEQEPPYERRVTEMLASSLVALESASAEAAATQGLGAFDRAVPKGVSANLCDAVVGLWAGDDAQRHLEFTFSWAPSRPAGENAIRRVVIGSDRLPVIREAARQMRDRAPIPEFDLSGPVVRLTKEEGADVGKVTVVGIVGSRQARVGVDLGGPDYHKAVTAHDQGKSLSLLGTLVKEGRGFALHTPSNVGVLDD